MKIPIGTFEIAAPYLKFLEHLADISGGSIVLDASGVSFQMDLPKELELPSGPDQMDEVEEVPFRLAA